MSIRIGTLTVTLTENDPLIVPAGSKVTSSTASEDGLDVAVWFSYDYEPFRLVTTPSFEFAADRIELTEAGLTVTRGVVCVSHPGGNGKPRTYSEKE